MHSELEAGPVLETIVILERRITERFPKSGLSRVGMELRREASEVEASVESLRRPAWALRAGAVVGTLGIVGITLGFVRLASWKPYRLKGIVNLLQATEAGVNVIILLAMAVYFLYSLETRTKRKMALEVLHRLRSIVHIIDMHQLTKDPEYALSPGMTTSSSPKRGLTRFLLVRYLAYCSELLSLTSKLAALHVQHLNDPVVLDAVSDIETLAASLSNKIWQKIVILDAALPASTLEDSRP